MPYPWPSFGGFLFTKSEQAVWQTDSGWAYTPSISRQRPMGSNRDAIITTSIGSAERSFEILFDPQRLITFQGLLNTRALFSDWRRPTPDSRNALLIEVSPITDVIARESRQDAVGSTNGSIGIYTTRRKIRVRVTFVEA